MLVCTGIGLSSIWGLKKTSLSIHYSSSSTGGKSTALIKCCIFQMNKNHFRTPGEQHNYLSTAPYSQHHLHHLRLFQYFFLTRMTICTRARCWPSSSDISASHQQQYGCRSRGQTPSLLSERPQEVPRGPSPRDGEQLHSCSAPLAPPHVAAAAQPGYKGRGANFLWHMLLQSALLHLLSGFVLFEIAEAPLLSQLSLSLSIQPADTLVFCLHKHTWLLWMWSRVIRPETSEHPLPSSHSMAKLMLHA